MVRPRRNSYGTTRVAALSQHLHQRFGIDLHGVILISPVLNYDTILFHPTHDLPCVLFLPSYAATAHYHGMTSKTDDSNALAKLIQEAEEFSLGTYLILLARGYNLTEDDKSLLLNKLRHVSGLSEQLIERNNYRGDWAEFTKNLLKGEKKIVGRMDGTITGTDLNPADSTITYDPSLDTLYGPFSSVMNAYVREDLKCKSDLYYEILNSEVNMKWH